MYFVVPLFLFILFDIWTWFYVFRHVFSSIHHPLLHPFVERHCGHHWCQGRSNIFFSTFRQYSQTPVSPSVGPFQWPRPRLTSPRSRGFHSPSCKTASWSHDGCQELTHCGVGGSPEGGGQGWGAGWGACVWAWNLVVEAGCSEAVARRAKRACLFADNSIWWRSAALVLAVCTLCTHM